MAAESANAGGRCAVCGKGRGRWLEAKADLSLTYCGIFIFFPAANIHVARQIRQAGRGKKKEKPIGNSTRWRLNTLTSKLISYNNLAMK